MWSGAGGHLWRELLLGRGGSLAKRAAQATRQPGRHGTFDRPAGPGDRLPRNALARMKGGRSVGYGLLDLYRGRLLLRKMCALLGLSPSAYYRYRMVTKESHGRGYAVNHKRVYKLMKTYGLTKKRPRFVKTTDSTHAYPVAPTWLGVSHQRVPISSGRPTSLISASGGSSAIWPASSMPFPAGWWAGSSGPLSTGSWLWPPFAYGPRASPAPPWSHSLWRSGGAVRF